MATEIKSVILQKLKSEKEQKLAQLKLHNWKIYYFFKNYKLMFILLGNLSHKNKHYMDAVSQLPDVKIVPQISKRCGIFIIKNKYSNLPKLSLPQSDIFQTIGAQTANIAVSTSHKQIIQTCQLCQLKAYE